MFAKRYLFLVAVLLLITGLVLSAYSGPAPAAAPTTPAKVFKARATVDSPRAHIKTQGLIKFADVVKERTKGRVVIDVFDSAQLYKAADGVKAADRGIIEMAEVGYVQISGLVKGIDIEGFPTFAGIGAADIKKLLHGEFGKLQNQLIESKLNLKVLLPNAQGEWLLANNKKLVKTPVDLKGLKIRTVGGPVAMGRIRALGAEPMAIDWADTIPALQQGVIDGLETTVVSFVDMKIWEVQRYATFSNHTGPNIHAVLVNKTWWNSLDKDLQAIIEQASTEVGDWLTGEIYKQQATAADLLVKNGMQVHSPSASEVNLFRSKIMPIEEELLKKQGYDAKLLQAAKNDLGRP